MEINNKPKMKIPIECPIFRAYLQKIIPDAFDADGLINKEHEARKSIQDINIDGIGAGSLDGIGLFDILRYLDIDYNPKIKHLPRLPNTLEEFYSNQKFKTSVQPVFFNGAWNYILLDNGRVLCGDIEWVNLNKFKEWAAERHDKSEFTQFIVECEQYLAKLNKT